MAELSGEGGLRVGEGSLPRRGGPLLLRGVPFGQPLSGHTDWVRWGAWSIVGDRPALATGSDDGTVRLWDPGTGKALGEPLAGHVGPVWWGAWSIVGDRPVLATGGRDRTVRLWDPGTGEALGDPLAGHTHWAQWGAWGIVGDRPALATGGSDGTVRLWDPGTGTALGEPLAGHAGTVQWGAWGIIGDRPALATGGSDGTVRLWDPSTGTALGEPLAGHAGLVQWGAWGIVGDRPVLATGGRDGTVRLWDPSTGTALGEPLAGHAGPVWWGAWGIVGDRPVLATGDLDGPVRLWDPGTGTALGVPLASTDPVVWGAWGIIGDRPVLATDGRDGTVRLWDPGTGTALGEPLAGHSGLVQWGAWGIVGDRPVLATGSADDATVRLWEVIEDHPVPRLPFYRSDVTAPADELSRVGDAVALAELVTAVTARPPLAVGLFGDWGEGKSHFLGLLQEQVAAAARPDNLLAHSSVRQVRFNAWHYAETDLWASLVAELFAQLAAAPEGDLGAEQRRQSRLAADLISERGLSERLHAARDRQDALQQELRKAERDDLGSWEALTEEQKLQLALLIGGGAEKFYRDAVRTAASLRETGHISWRLLRTLRPAHVAQLAVILAVVVAAAVVVGWVIPGLLRWSVTASAVAAVLTVADLWRRVRAETTKRDGPAWKTAVRMGDAQRQRLQTASDVVAAEVAALEREMQDLTAAGQLAGMVADRAAGEDYRSRLGVMTRIREDFTRMAVLLADAADPRRSGARPGLSADEQSRRAGADGNSPATDAAGDTLPRIDRIILYIDDLDRCPPRRVVEMLEAIHLLLALPLFVVVVAVDPRWLLRAIAAHYRDLLQALAPASSADQAGPVDPDDEELWNSTPAQYLEKIFQVVLTLPPLDTGGYQRLLRTLVGTRPDQATPAPAAAAAPVAASSLPVLASPDGRRNPDAAGQWNEAGMFGVTLPAARAVERVDPLTLEHDELALLDLLGPPLLITTPRAVKRLANSYGLLTALRREYRAADLREHHALIADPAAGEARDLTYYPYRAGMVLLAALIAFPALGPALFLHLHHTATRHPDETWEHFLASLQPVQESGGWHNPADPSMTPVQAQQWQALLDGLQHVARTAPEHHLPLPEPLSSWHQWVVPVGRLSFPTGRIVNTLDRQRPLPGTDPTAKPEPRTR